MTTIACDGKSMAGDGRACRNDLIVNEAAVKVHRLADGSLFGGAGDKHELQELRAWLDAGAQGSPPKAKDFAAFVLKRNGELWYHTDRSVPVLTEAPNAVGCGEELAIGAMEAGASAQQAIEIASRRNTSTGGKITALHLEVRE